jgi:hypothetical protein
VLVLGTATRDRAGPAREVRYPRHTPELSLFGYELSYRPVKAKLGSSRTVGAYFDTKLSNSSLLPLRGNAGDLQLLTLEIAK